MIKQVGLLPAGCQPWNNSVCAASGDRFAYCSTLAIYVYELDKKYNQFRLLSILSEHKKTITAIAWNPRNPDIFVSASHESKLIVWDISKERPIAIYENTKGIPTDIDWCLLHGESVSYINGKGPLFLWSYKGADLSVSSVKETGGFSSEVTCFKWHQKKTEKVAFGHKDGTLSFCYLGLKCHRNVLKPELDEDDDDNMNDSVVALEWDLLSVDYILVCNSQTGIRLVDSTSLSMIMTFQLPSAATSVKTLSWISSAPGMFITGDAMSGNLRVWNVSKSTPVENIRVKKTGFHALQVICDNNRQKLTKYSEKSTNLNQKSSTSLAQNPSVVNSANFALPPARVVCTFLDGGVGLYDLGRRKWDFLREQGHIETIFDCKFCPHDSNILATGSFDGTIKLWDTTTFTCVNTSPGNEGIIYTISWAPSDLNCIVAGTSKNGIFIWDIGKGRIVKRFSEHGRNAVFTVMWNQKDSRRIMSTGADGYCIIRQVDGEIIQKYRHPAAIYGCDWSPHNKDMLATGCEDKSVRVFYTATSSEHPLKVFTGHTAKVFHVKWSPLKENLLCSGSDDGTIRVWDYSQDACICTLSGHKGPVRGLLWNSEIPYLVISGSWDASIRMWDIREEGKCIQAIADHGADVYGLTCHPARPFILASSSRDSTVRLWSLASLAQPIEINILAGKPWTQILGTIESVMTPKQEPLLTGRVSRELKVEAEEFPNDARNRVVKFFSKFFRAPAGTQNLWELVSVVKGLDDTLLSPNYKKGILHVKHLIRHNSSEAQQLEMAKLTKFGGGIGARSKEDRLRDAAEIHLKTGNIQRYCELMVELGEWERALAVAPGVSYTYWKNLANRYSKYLMQEDKDSAAVYCTAVGNTEMLVDFYASRGQMSDAVLTAQVACEGLAPGRGDMSNEKGLCNGWEEPSEQHKQLLQQTVEDWAAWHSLHGSPVLAACCFLAVDNPQKAMGRLIQGNELELAVAMGTVLGNLQQYTSVALEMLSRRCERLGKWELAIDLLHQIPDNRILLAKCCSRCALSNDEINGLHKRAHLPPIVECFHEAEKLKRRNDTFECAVFYLLSASPELGLELGMDYVKNMLKSSDWTVDDVFFMLQLIGCVRTDVLQVNRKRGELLAVSAYIGALVAIRRGYYSIVHPLFQHARQLLQTDSYIDFGVSESAIQSQYTAWNVVHTSQPEEPVNVEIIPAEYKPAYVKLQQRLGEEPNKILVGTDCVSNTHLPSHSDIHLSCLTGERIQGLAYFLEDGKSAVSANEALMWAKVNPFSPLATGYRINPF
ncbi:WD repeat-containing protein 17-like [Mercenaria mercenaria]|uniref:WD repeat-containing protein 17-like n=1 Tax=Mercenaria mercenaria TaxID=6596 RepID=UPI00234EB0D9|nr:WD repeat-containing protein 17-like [Mercenaria mercenaria]